MTREERWAYERFLVARASYNNELLSAKEEGRAEGRAEGLQFALIRQLQRKFTNIPDDIIAQIETTENNEQLGAWLDALWDVDSLTEMNFDIS